MPKKDSGYRTTALEIEVLNDLRKFTHELSIAENERITLSDAVRTLLQTYRTMYPEFKNGS